MTDPGKLRANVALTAEAVRRERQAAELRANLKRRKEQARARASKIEPGDLGQDIKINADPNANEPK